MLVGAEEVLYAVVSAVVEEVEEPAEVVSAVTDNARVREGGGRGGSSLRKGVDLSHGSGDGGRMTGKTGIGLERQDLTGTQDRAVVVSGVVAACAWMHRKGRAPRGDQRLLSSPRKIMNRGLQNQHAKGITSLYFR